MGSDLHTFPWGSVPGELQSEIHLPCGCRFASYNNAPVIAQWCGVHSAAEACLLLMQKWMDDGTLGKSGFKEAFTLVAEARKKKDYAPFPGTVR